MRINKLIFSAILLCIGTLLHLFTPALVMGVKPDFLLVMLFICLGLAHSLKEVLIVSLTAGLIAALTTQFPMGQLPNLMDKLVTAFIIYQMMQMFKEPINVKKMALLCGIGTLISGTIFISSACLLIGQTNFLLPGLFVVILTIPLNVCLSIIVYKSVSPFLTRINWSLIE